MDNGKCCPHCQEPLSTVETPALSQWQGIEVEMCLNNFCEFFLSSWQVMREQGVFSGYRYFKIPNGSSGSMAVASIDAYTDCVITPEIKSRRKRATELKELEYVQLKQTIKDLEHLIKTSNGAQRDYNIQMVEWLKELKKTKFAYKD